MFRPLRQWPAAFAAPRSPQVQARPPRRSGQRPARRRLCLEQLEGRLVLSTLQVTTLADGGAGSLRDAITQANALPGADVVVFDDGLTGTIALTGGELDIADDLTINGPGADKLTVSGGNISRIFQVAAGETVLLSDLTIAGGNAGSGNGGGIDNLGTLTVSHSSFTSNGATVGGGIDNRGTATVTGSTFRRNTAGSGNGGLNNETGGLLTQFDNRFLDDQPPDVFP
jgi:hypothetical protein